MLSPSCGIRFGRICAVLILVVVAPVLAPPARGDQSSAGKDGERRETVKLVLYPAPEPRPALRYRLLPAFMELRPGNAAVMYNKIGIQITEPARSKLAMRRTAFIGALSDRRLRPS